MTGVTPAPAQEQLELRRGAGDAFAAAFEMVATPALFGLAGWWLDTRLGTFPLVTVIAVLVVFGYGVWRFARQYSARVDEALEARRAGYAAAPGSPVMGGGSDMGGHPAPVGPVMGGGSDMGGHAAPVGPVMGGGSAPREGSGLE